MTPSERERIELLDRYWDALAAGGTVDLAALDPALTEPVRDLRALHQPPAIDPDFQRHLGERLLGASSTDLPARHSLRPIGVPIPNSLNGHSSEQVGLAAIQNQDRRRWWTTSLAAAAVLALVLLGSLLALRFVAREQQHAPTMLDAVHRPTVETLIDAAVENPSLDWTPLTVERWTFQPGEAALVIAPLDGPQWIVAERGSLTVSVGGTDRTLAERVGIVVPAGEAITISNPGRAQAEALRGMAAAGFPYEDYPRDAMKKQTALDTEAHEALPPGASRIVFEQLTLDSGSTFVLEPASGQDWLAVSSGRLGVTLLGEGLPLGWQSGREREFANDELLPVLAPGTRVTLHNIGEEPLVMLRLRVMPTQASGGANSESQG